MDATNNLKPSRAAKRFHSANAALVEASASSKAGGRFGSVSDEEILIAQRRLAAAEGIFVEPGSAASVAGLLKDIDSGADFRGRTMVVTVTGHGLKDIDTALSTFTDLVDTVVEADVAEAAEAAGLR